MMNIRYSAHTLVVCVAPIGFDQMFNTVARVQVTVTQTKPHTWLCAVNVLCVCLFVFYYFMNMGDMLGAKSIEESK